MIVVVLTPNANRPSLTLSPLTVVFTYPALMPAKVVKSPPNPLTRTPAMTPIKSRMSLPTNGSWRTFSAGNTSPMVAELAARSVVASTTTSTLCPAAATCKVKLNRFESFVFNSTLLNVDVAKPDNCADSLYTPGSRPGIT